MVETVIGLGLGDQKIAQGPQDLKPFTIPVARRFHKILQGLLQSSLCCFRVRSGARSCACACVAIGQQGLAGTAFKAPVDPATGTQQLPTYPLKSSFVFSLIIPVTDKT